MDELGLLYPLVLRLLLSPSQWCFAATELFLGTWHLHVKLRLCPLLACILTPDAPDIAPELVWLMNLLELARLTSGSAARFSPPLATAHQQTWHSQSGHLYGSAGFHQLHSSSAW